MKSELFSKKTQNKNEVRFRLPPRSLSRASLRGYGKPKQKNFLYIFYFFRAQFFLLKGKENFSVAPVRRIGGCFSFSEKSGNTLFLIAKGQKFLPPDPLPFCSFAFRASPDFFAGLQNQRTTGGIIFSYISFAHGILLV